MDQLKTCRKIVTNNSANVKIPNNKTKLISDIINILSVPIWEEIRINLPWMYTHPYKKIEILTSATSAYVGLLFYRIINRIKIDDTQSDKDIVTLYLISDFILDDSNVSKHTKIELKRCVECRRISPYPHVNKLTQDDKVRDLVIVLDRLLLKEYNRDAIYEAWDSEIASTKQLECLDFDTLWDISAKKGHKTIKMAACIINKGVDLPSSYLIGSITQFMDDLMDFQRDKDDNINTAVTVSINDDNLDYYVYRLLEEINKCDIPEFQLLFTQAVCLLSINNKHTSRELVNIMSVHLLYNTNKNLEDIIKICV
jgi:hypothetical protein